MNRDILRRILCGFLTVCMTFVLFAGIPLRAGAEDADAFADLWEQIEALRDGVEKRGKKATVYDYASISDEVYALVEQSGTAVPGSLQANGDFIKWRDNETGIPCCYSPAHEADKGTVSYIADKDGSIAELEHNEALLRAMAKRGGAPSSVNIGLIQPYYRDSSNYYDDSFVSYSPTYLQQANALAAKTGGQVIRYTLEDATLDTIAATLESCGMVIFDSHGGTDYTNPNNSDDSTSRANCSYLWLSSGYKTSSDFRSHWLEFLSYDEYYGSHTGPFGSYDNVYLSSDGSYCVSGQLIADHMRKNAPHSFLYMGICLGMATDGMQAPLRAKGVEAVYGYSQSVTFSGEKKYVTSITNSLINGKTVGEAVASAKKSYGNWDYYSYYNTVEKARANYCAFPIVVSSEDPYPGHGNVDAVQTVNSTWTLIPRYAVTATVNDSSLGTVSVSATTITASPKDGYYVQSAEIVSGSGSCTINGNTIDVNPQSPCTVLVTFAPKPQVTLTLIGAASPITGTAGSTVTLPATAEAKDGLEFVGWTADGLEQESTELPEYHAPGSSYTLPYANTTLYALYTYFDESVVTPITPRYVRVTPEDNFASVVGTGNSFLIAVEVTSSAYVFNSSLSTPYANKNYQYISYLNGEKGVLPSNSTTTACAVRIAPISGTSYYSMRLKNGSGSYVKSGKAVGITTTSSAYKLTVDTTTAEDCHYIRDSSYTSYRFMMNDHADGGYCFGFTNEAAYKTLLYRYEDKIIGQRYYLTAEPCRHTNTVLTGAQSPTCTSDGYTGDSICDDCGVTVTSGEVIPMLGHSYEYAVTTAPTTAAAGMLTGTCTRDGCGSTVTVTLPKLNKTAYTYEVITAATCMATGTDRYTWKTTDYGTYFFEVTTAALGHSYGYSVTKNPTFTAEGTIKATCKRSGCGDTFTSPMPAFNTTDYDYEVTKEPTCMEKGSGRYSKVYGNTRFQFGVQLAALGHDYIDHEAQAATCTEIGWNAYRTCSRCDYTTYQEIAALEHDIITHEAKAPTCTEVGWNAYETCSRCDYSTYQEIRALDHDIVTHKAKAPTCTEVGWNAYETCSRCDYTTYQEIASLGHDRITDPAVAATCTQDGLTAGYHCSRCDGDTLAQEVIPMLGHDRVTDAAVAATCTETGLTEGYHCSRCDDDTLAQEVTPKLGHELAWDGNVGDGTSHVLACSRCDYTENEACTMNNGICTICGYKVIDIASAALKLDNDVDISYTVTVPDSADKVYMVFEMNGTETIVEDDGTHSFLFEGVNPQCMGDNVSATLYATVDGVEYTDAQPTYSVLQYCRNKLADRSISAELRTLLSDMLAYGAAAQNYVSYKTTALVSDDSELTDPTFSTFTPISGYVPVFAGADAPDVYWKAAGLTLRNNVAMNFTFYAESIEGLSIKVTLNGREETFTTFVPVEGKANTYKVTFYDITATEFYEDVTATFYRNNAQVGNSLTYSVNAYICAKQADSNTALADLVKALYNYGASAKAYAE